MVSAFLTFSWSCALPFDCSLPTLDSLTSTVFSQDFCFGGAAGGQGYWCRCLSGQLLTGEVLRFDLIVWRMIMLLTHVVCRHFTGDESFLDDPNGFGYDPANYAAESKAAAGNRTKDSRL